MAVERRADPPLTGGEEAAAELDTLVRPGQRDGPGAAAEAVARLEQLDRDAGRGEVARGTQPGEAPAGDYDVDGADLHRARHSGASQASVT